MKLHLPLSLFKSLKAVLACCGLTLATCPFALHADVVVQLQADTEAGTTLTWSEGAGQGYTGEDNTRYHATGLEWNIESGTYTSKVEGLSISDNIALYSGSSLTVAGVADQSATLNINGHATESNATGIDVSGTSSLRNLAGGEINVEVASDKTSVYGIDLSSSTIVNGTGAVLSSVVASNALGDYWGRGMYLGRSEFQNSGEAHIQATAHHAHGISASQGTLVNTAGGYINTSSNLSTVAYDHTGDVDELPYSAGMRFSGGARIDNQGTIETTGWAFSHPDNSYNYSANGLHLLGNGSSLNNSGTISAIANGGDTNQGIMLAEYATLTNAKNSLITAMGQGSTGSMSMGIDLMGGALLTNYGSLQASGQGLYAYGIALQESTLVNEAGGIIDTRADGGVVQGLGSLSAEIGMRNGAVLYNSGTLKGSRVWLSQLDPTNMTGAPSASAPGNSVYLLDGSIVGASARGTDVDIAAIASLSQETVYLGGVRGDSGVGASEGGASVISTTSNLGFHGVAMMNLASKLHLALVGDVTLKMGGNLTVGENVVTDWQGKALTVDNGGTQRSVSWSGAFEGSWSKDFTIREDGEGGYTLQQGSRDEKQVSLRGQAARLADGKLTATQELTIGGEGSPTELSSATDSLELRSGRSGSVDNATLRADSVTLEAGAGGFTLDGAAIEQGAGGKGSLRNVIVTGASRLSGGSMLMEHTILMLTEQNSVSAGLLQDESLTFHLASTLIDNMSVSGSLTLDFSAWEAEILSGRFREVAVSFGEGVTLEMGASMVQASLEGMHPVTASSVEGNAVIFSVDAFTAVPEPATATLSLLALVALAARRRRR